jgi:putative endonuclease
MSTDKRYRKKLGAWGEGVASEHLINKGYQLLEKNYHTRHGEIDLIMTSGNRLVAVEVKTRKSTTYGIAEDSITRKKYLAIQAAMYVYLESHPELDPDWQLDIMVIETVSAERPEIIHYENIYLDYLND